MATEAARLKGRTHREKEKNKNILTRKKEKTYLTLTGLLMEGVEKSGGHVLVLI